jgi:hypothetical protein
MATLAEIRTALASAISTATGMQAYDSPPGSIEAPCSVIRRLTTTLGTSTGSDDDLIGAIVLVQFTDNAAAQATLDAAVASVVAAVEADPTLGGVVDFAMPTTVGADGITEYPPASGLQYLSAEVTIQVGA